MAEQNKKKNNLKVIEFPSDESADFIEKFKERTKQPGYLGTLIIGFFNDDIDFGCSSGAMFRIPHIVHALEFIKHKLLLEEVTGVPPWSDGEQVYTEEDPPIDPAS